MEDWCRDRNFTQPNPPASFPAREAGVWSRSASHTAIDVCIADQSAPLSSQERRCPEPVEGGWGRGPTDAYQTKTDTRKAYCQPIKKVVYSERVRHWVVASRMKTPFPEGFTSSLPRIAAELLVPVIKTLTTNYPAVLFQRWLNQGAV